MRPTARKTLGPRLGLGATAAAVAVALTACARNGFVPSATTAIACNATTLPCAAGSFCNNGTCTVCNTAAHCGPSCDNCTLGFLSCRPDASGCAAVTDCTGKPDFTACSVDTTASQGSDRSYDICVGGTCVSPGCGDETCNPPRPNFALPDTNQRTCYDNTGPLTACPGVVGTASCATTAFCGQDAQYGRDTTNSGVARFVRSSTASGEPVVDDQITGLEWQGCARGLSGADCTVGSNNEALWSDALAYCDGLTWNGASNWRLPDEFELQSIVDYNGTDPYVDAAAFPGTPQFFTWSASFFVGLPASGLVVGFHDGSVVDTGMNDYSAVRCVRRVHQTGKPLTQRYTVTQPTAGQPVVSDAETGLIWQGCAKGYSGAGCTGGTESDLDWQQALSYCEGLNWGGSTDWRLPNVDELRSLTDTHRDNPVIDVAAFPATPTGNSWTSTTDGVNPTKAFVTNFSGSGAYAWDKTTANAVRCVRGGG